MKLIVGMSRERKNSLCSRHFRELAAASTSQEPKACTVQYPLNHFVSEPNQIVEIASNQHIKDEFELLLPRNDQLASFTALEELMQANAYRSDQIAATRKRVIAIMEHDLQPSNLSGSDGESLFAHYAEHELKFNHSKVHKIPVEIKVFLLDIDIPLRERIKKYEFKPTDSSISNLLLRYKKNIFNHLNQKTILR